MINIDWQNNIAIVRARDFFDVYITAWNPCDIDERNNTVHWCPNDDPCLLDTNNILATDGYADYVALLNRVQRHTKCKDGACLRKKGQKKECRYKAPWKEQPNSTLTCDELGKKEYALARNDDRLNVHNPKMLSIWRANIDCQAVTSNDQVLKYIAKYTTKAEKMLEICKDMLTRICTSSQPEDLAMKAYRKFMMELVVERDISAQETCHMLQKLPLVMSNRTFTNLNVGCKILHRFT